MKVKEENVAKAAQAEAEVETTQADELAKSLDMYAVFASPSYPPAPSVTDVPDFAGIDLGIAVLSRWPILDQDTLSAGHDPARRGQP